MSRDHFTADLLTDKSAFTRDVLLLDNCEGTCLWTGEGTGADFTADFLAAAARRGLKGLRIKTRVTTPAAGDAVGAYRYFSCPETGVLLLRSWIALPTPGDVAALDFVSAIGHGVTMAYGGIWCNVTAGTTHRIDDTGGYTACPTLDFTWRAGGWHCFEFAVDRRNHNYLFVGVDGARLDLTGIPYFTYAAPPTISSHMLFDVYTAADAPATLYADDMMATANPNL